MCSDFQARPRSNAGFTLTELLIVVTVIAILASIAVPNYLGSRIVGNEAAVISTMRQISASELIARETRVIDVDRNGIGEFGFLGELSGLTAMRGSGIQLRPPALNPSFGRIDANGQGERHGYLFRLFLPDAAGVGLAEMAANLANVDPQNSSICFSCVAWPLLYGKSGQRTFFVNQRGETVATVDSAYNGTAGAPIANAALIGVPPGIITGSSLATGGEVGVDGNRWRAVN
jgi:prepilin-type N-terminal cleavage/methylation domain-containing protein